ncbi:MAG: ribokinase [Sphaerochaetaceae bacterium]|nr:ribokinase [Sphaerochaetaceae bacterium]MDC7246814.1 ribokinase [Sphaerochaetaceae bacterium]
MPIFNFGSTNIDIIFKVDHIVQPGETIGSASLKRSTGGKGANQSVGACYAGGEKVYHVGKIGPDGDFIRSILQEKGVDTTFLREGETPTGQALIQVSKEGQNSIVLYSGGNKEFTEEEVLETLAHTHTGDWILLQNETNQLSFIIEQAKKRDLNICFNPAPFDRSVLDLPLHLLDVLVVNEVEAEGIAHTCDPFKAIDILCSLYEDSEIIITLGSHGVMHKKGSGPLVTFGTWDVDVADTTAAGDCFIGCYIASRAKGIEVGESLYRASAASSITVMRDGAIPSIPSADELKLLDSYPFRQFSLHNQE